MPKSFMQKLVQLVNSRHKFDMIKVREVNDFHHAKDAYLNIVVGNTYYVKFTKDAGLVCQQQSGTYIQLKENV